MNIVEIDMIKSRTFRILEIPHLQVEQVALLPLTAEQREPFGFRDDRDEADAQWQPVVERLQDGYYLRNTDDWAQYSYAPIAQDGTVDLNDLESVIQAERRKQAEEEERYWANRMQEPVPSGCERLLVEKANWRYGTVVVSVERYGKYRKPFRVTVVSADEGTGFQVGDRLRYFQGNNLPEGKTDAELAFWGQVPPNPVCPKCGRGANLGYNYEGDKVSCWSLVGNWPEEKRVTCWSGSVIELKEDAAHANPWVAQISDQGSHA